MVGKVAAAIGEPESFVRECKDGWAFGGAAFRAQLQWAAFEEFELRGAAIEHLDLAKHNWKHRKFLLQTYEDSQKFLADLGVKELLVVRTMNLSANKHRLLANARDWVPWKFQLQPLSSFTLQPEMVLDGWGQQFGHMPYDNQVCVTARAIIPASRVWSVPGPGIGAKIDYEVIVLGGLFECEAIAHDGRVRAEDVW